MLKRNCMTKILFKHQYTIWDLSLSPDSTVAFSFNGPHNINIVLRAPTQEEQANGHKSTSSFCIASSEIESKSAVGEIFKKISCNQIVPADTPDMEVSLLYSTPEGLQIRLPPLIDFPPNFIDFVRNADRELFDWANRTISVFRWRVNDLGPHNPIGPEGLFWSFTGAFWHRAPLDWRVHIFTSKAVELFDQYVIDVKRIVEAGGAGPIHHDLFREAWDQFGQNPRSALIVGIAAAEVAVKKCISILIPDTEWIVSNLPSPPIVQILTEYLTQLPVRFKINDKVKTLPPEIISTIKKGVTLRNDLSHTGKGNITSDNVEEILQAIQDVLWLMDFYSGSEWAFEYISPKTKEFLQTD